MSTTGCCYIADAPVLRSPALTRSDERALVAIHGCHSPAAWEIIGASGRPDDFTHACDAHLREMQCPGDTVHRL